MPPKVTAASEDSSACSISSSYEGLELSSASHSIAKKKKEPIIRVVHVFAPKLIKTEAANFRALVQKLTGNHASNDDEEEEVINHNHHANHNVSQEINHQKTPELRHQKEINHSVNHGYHQEINHQKALESKHQKEINQSFNHGYFNQEAVVSKHHKKRKATISPYNPATSSSSVVLKTKMSAQLQQIDEDSIYHFGFMEAGLASSDVGLARIDERSWYFPARLARSDEGIHYFPTNDAYNYSSPSSLDSSNTGGTSFNERGSSPSVFVDELDIMGSFHDDPHLPPLFLSTF